VLVAGMASIDMIIFSTWIFWLSIAIIPFVALLVDLVVKLVSRTCFKSLSDKILELEMAKEAEALVQQQQQQAPQMPVNTDETLTERAKALVCQMTPGASGAGTPSPKTKIQTPAQQAVADVQHGYSFTQAEGRPGGPLTQARLIRMYNTAMAKPQVQH